MRYQLFKTDNHMGISLPRAMLEALQLAEGEAVVVELVAEHRRIVITPATVGAEGVNTAFAKQVAEFIEEYRPALEASAK